MNEYSELEYKYKADSVKLTDFLKLMSNLNPVKKLEVASWDHYYTCEEDFIRFRNSPTPELTIKRKLKESNNWTRTEVDLDLLPEIKEETVTKFVELLGYKENFKIYKNCFVFWLDNVNYVWYSVYDENLKELGRFIEVEVIKKNINNLIDPIDTLNKAAKELEQVGLSPQNRMKKSLFELYKK
jgi:adenylate cyclase class IV